MADWPVCLCGCVAPIQPVVLVLLYHGVVVYGALSFDNRTVESWMHHYKTHTARHNPVVGDCEHSLQSEPAVSRRRDVYIVV